MVVGNSKSLVKTLFSQKWTYGSGIMKLLVLLCDLGDHNTFLFLVFLDQFLVTYCQVKFNRYLTKYGLLAQFWTSCNQP